MKLQKISFALLAIFLTIPCSAQKAQKASKTNKGKGAKVVFVNKEAERKVDVMIGGKLFTSYTWPTNVYKPVLYPVYTANGTEITRGFPLRPRAGERNDHIHQVGIWLNYGNVNGLDFWGNGSTGKKNPRGGEVIHLSVDRMKGGNGEGVMVTKESWVDPSGKELLSELTEYHFIAQGSLRIVDRLTTLISTSGEVKFADTKEGMFGIRVARQLELPSKDKGVLIDAQGNPSEKRASSNEGVTGNYRSSEGVTGDAVWSTRAKWMNLFGSIGNEKISIVVCDHPRNVSYPTYWHARGYGLFSANPLGVKDFTQGKEELNLTLQNGQSTTFRYRVIVNTGADLTDAQINKLCDEFAQKYK
jgi:hypothetical protein